MADVKISQLPASTTPLDGTEVLPIVQSATTKQVSVANLTAGRAVSALSLSLTNALPVTSGGTGLATTAAGTLLSSTALNTISATATPTLGVAGTTAGTLGLSGSSSGVVTLATASGAAGTWTMRLPTTGGTNGYILTTDGSGVTTWTNPTALGVDLNVGTTVVSDGTSGRILYNNAGVLGEYSSVPVSFGGTGLTSLTAGYIPYGNGTGAFSSGSGLSYDGTTLTANSVVKIAGSSNPYLVLNDGTYNAYLQITGGVFNAYTASIPMTFSPGGSEKVRFDASGNVCIGTTSAYGKLNLVGGRAFFMPNSETFALGLGYSSSTGGYYYLGATNSATPDLVFSQTGGSERMRLTNAGNLGLGNTSPNSYADGQGVTLVAGTNPNWATIQGRTDGPTGATNGVSYGGSYGSNPINGSRIFLGAQGASGQQGMIAFYVKNVNDNTTQPTQAMTLDASGQLGLGVTPSYKFDMAGAATAGMTTLQQIRTGSGNSFGFQIKGNHTNDEFLISNYYNAALLFGTNNTVKMTLSAGGYLGINQTSPSNLIHVTAATSAVGQAQVLCEGGPLGYGAGISFQSRTSVGGTLVEMGRVVADGESAWNTTASTQNSYLRFYSTYQGTAYERARIDSSGSLLVGTTSASASSGQGVKILPGGLVYAAAPTSSGDNYNYYNTTASAYRFYVSSAGTIYATSTTITAISDRRLKENIVDLDVGLDALLTLKPRKFDWKAGRGKDIKGDRGWIADEFQQVFPDLIDTWKDEPPEGEEPYKSVRPDLMPVVVKAIQELAAKVSALEAKQ